MLGKERLHYIVKRLENDSALSVATLSKELNVSLSTIQRDLRKLEKDGEITREHGGALSNDFSKTLSPFTEVSVDRKVALHQKEKDLIAQTAQELIQDNDCIFIDSGTTTAHLAPYLMNRNITIVTNSHYLLQKLRGCKAKVIILGGEYDSKYDMSKGSLTIQEIYQFHFDRCFISGNGMDVEAQEIYSVESENGMIKKAVMERSTYKYLMIDSSKFEVRAMYSFANQEAFDQIFVDAYPQHKKRNKRIIVC